MLYGAAVTWSPQTPRFRLLHLLLSWLVTAAAVFIAAAIAPGARVRTFGDALVAAALIGAHHFARRARAWVTSWSQLARLVPVPVTRRG